MQMEVHLLHFWKLWKSAETLIVMKYSRDPFISKHFQNQPSNLLK